MFGSTLAIRRGARLNDGRLLSFRVRENTKGPTNRPCGLTLEQYTYMENVQPVLGSPIFYYLALAVAAAFVLNAMRHVYLYFVFRGIDKHGFTDPELQAMHKRSIEAEKGKFFTRTRLQAVYAAVWVAGAAFAVWQLYSIDQLGSLYGQH